MTSSILNDMATLGFLSRARTLHRLGHSRSAVSTAVAQGTLLRPVRSWVATPQAERDAVIALLHGGVLTGASALASHGLWRGLDRSIHVLVPPNSPGRVSRSAVPIAAFAQPRHVTSGVVRHWGQPRWPTRGLDWRVCVLDALLAFALTADVENFVAAVDSALFTKALNPAELAWLFSALPARFARVRALVDGKAEAGTESLVRLRARGLARTVETQVRVGRYRIDLLLDGWLAVEIDSEEWHSSTRVNDLRKSTWLTANGYRVEHYDYQQVMYEWPSVEGHCAARSRFGRRIAAVRACFSY